MNRRSRSARRDSVELESPIVIRHISFSAVFFQTGFVYLHALSLRRFERMIELLFFLMRLREREVLTRELGPEIVTTTELILVARDRNQKYNAAFPLRVENLPRSLITFQISSLAAKIDELTQTAETRKRGRSRVTLANSLLQHSRVSFSFRPFPSL